MSLVKLLVRIVMTSLPPFFFDTIDIEEKKVLFETVQEIFPLHRMLNGVKFMQKRIGLVLYLEVEEFASKAIPLTFIFIIVRKILYEEFEILAYLEPNIFTTWEWSLSPEENMKKKEKKGITSLILKELQSRNLYHPICRFNKCSE